MKNRAEEPDPDKKKSYRRSWRSTSPVGKIEIILLAIAAVGGIGYLGATIWGDLQTKWNFAAENRPRIVIGKPQIADSVTQQYGLNVGHPFFVEIHFENTGRSAALHVFIHRHVLFGTDYSRLKIEESDITEINQQIDPGNPMVTDAVSVQDTYKVESIYVDPNSMKPWDGTLPIVAFGRITYRDKEGTLYCTPFGLSWLNNQTFDALAAFPPQKISVTDLCPTGSIP